MIILITKLLNFAYKIKDTTESEPQDSETNDVVDLPKHRVSAKIITSLANHLDSDDFEICTEAVEGFSKLYMTGHVMSSKIFSKLFIMYYSPLTVCHTRLRACLTEFLPQFAFMRPINQKCVEDSFMLTLKCLMNVPDYSPLREIDIMSVMETMLHLLTNPNILKNHQRNPIEQLNTKYVRKYFRTLHWVLIFWCLFIGLFFIYSRITHATKI